MAYIVTEVTTTPAGVNRYISHDIFNPQAPTTAMRNKKKELEEAGILTIETTVSTLENGSTQVTSVFRWRSQTDREDHVTWLLSNFPNWYPDKEAYNTANGITVVRTETTE